MSLVITEDRGAVRHIVINRPEKRNALNGDAIRELGGAIEAAAADESVRVVIVRGEGAMFSSGMDLNDLRELAESPENLRSYRRPILNWWNLLEEMPKPTICQIHGAALGGAFELALACDFRRWPRTRCRIMECGWVCWPDVGGCSRLPALVGLGNAKELIMTGKVIDGREAYRIGFANRIAPADDLSAATDAFANELLACAPRAVGLAKRVLDAAAKPALALTLEQEVAAQETRASRGLRRGARAFSRSVTRISRPLTGRGGGLTPILDPRKRRARMPLSGPFAMRAGSGTLWPKTGPGAEFGLYPDPKVKPPEGASYADRADSGVRLGSTHHGGCQH